MLKFHSKVISPKPQGEYVHAGIVKEVVSQALSKEHGAENMKSITVQHILK